MTETFSYKLFSAIMLGILMWVFPASALAHFSDVTKSQARLAAGSLSISLETQNVADQNRKLTLSNTGSLNANYDAVLQARSTASDFCDDISVSMQINGNNSYTGTLRGFSLRDVALFSGATDDLEFAFSDSSSNPIQSGECSIQVAYEASQNGQRFGEAFYDSERDLFTLSASDFTTEAEPAAESERQANQHIRESGQPGGDLASSTSVGRDVLAPRSDITEPATGEVHAEELVSVGSSSRASKELQDEGELSDDVVDQKNASSSASSTGETLAATSSDVESIDASNAGGGETSSSSSRPSPPKKSDEDEVDESIESAGEPPQGKPVDFQGNEVEKAKSHNENETDEPALKRDEETQNTEKTEEANQVPA